MRLSPSNCHHTLVNGALAGHNCKQLLQMITIVARDAGHHANITFQNGGTRFGKTRFKIPMLPGSFVGVKHPEVPDTYQNNCSRVVEIY